MDSPIDRELANQAMEDAFAERTGPPLPPPVSYLAEVTVGTNEPYTRNGIRLPTREQADAYAFNLAMRWLQVVDWRVVEVAEPANYRWVEGKLEPIA